MKKIHNHGQYAEGSIYNAAGVDLYSLSVEELEAEVDGYKALMADVSRSLNRSKLYWAWLGCASLGVASMYLGWWWIMLVSAVSALIFHIEATQANAPLEEDYADYAHDLALVKKVLRHQRRMRRNHKQN